MPEALQAAATPNQALWYSHTLAGAKVILSGPSCFQPRAVQKEVVALQAQSSVLQSLARAGHAGLSPLNWAQRLQDSSNSQSQPGSLYRMPLVLGGLCICGGILAEQKLVGWPCYCMLEGSPLPRGRAPPMWQTVAYRAAEAHSRQELCSFWFQQCPRLIPA